ncbi:MAG: malate dehydrogenase [Candidatus Margulisbacteria bacterium]|jgi:malate dehydrogenase|nr:malate dehydrogenase [Candidatus Margulisiibacteriota bacterium]
MKPKVTVVGAGNVGAQCAYRLAQRGAADVTLIDVVEGLPQGKALDMSQAGAVDGFDALITGTNNYADTKESAVVVITAGLARKPGMSRDDLIGKNAAIMKSVVENSVKHSPHAVLLIVTNPLDVMTHYARRISGYPANRVLGMAPLLDAARMQYFIADTCKCSIKDVYAEVLGSHGDLMVPVPRLSTVKGKPITELLTAEQIKAIVDKTTNGGAEIVALLKSGSAYYAPGSAAAAMAEAIVTDSKKVISSCVQLSGQYGIKNVYLGAPAKLGKAGVEEVLEIELTAAEKGALQNAAQAVQALYPVLP